MTTEMPTLMSCSVQNSTYDPSQILEWRDNTSTGNLSIPYKYGGSLIQNRLPESSFFDKYAENLKKIINEENAMATKRIVKVFIVDTDDNLRLEDAILYQSEEKLTDLTDQELFIELGIQPILEKHNATRITTIDKKATTKAGKDIFLEPIRIRDLKMVVTVVAEFK